MAQCELCGKDNANIQAKVEGTMLRVCSSCSSLGEIISNKSSFGSSNFQQKKTFVPERKKDYKVIVSNYAQLIRNSREKLGLTQEEAALKIQERLSILQKIENSEMPPSMDMARKLESFYKIILVAEFSEDSEEKEGPRQKTSEMTIGDIMQKIRK